jgi:membrane complex biogenesis BtpA family protein
MQPWFRELFARAKPVIAMAHIPALPGTPRYDARAGVDGMIEKVRADLKHLIAGGVDAIMFSNEDDRPYVLHADPVQVAAMARVVTELRPREVPFGVDFMWDPIAALSIAAATGASFMREVVTGVYESDMGLWAPDAGVLLRLRHNLAADQVRVFFNVQPEFGASLGARTAGQRARSAVVSSLADAILVSGPMAGAEADREALAEAKAAVGDEVPVLLNTGARPDNIGRYLPIADGVIVASALKVDGATWNPVDPARVRAFMDAVKQVRGG